MAPYLLKTEPDEYSFDDLERERHTVWDGITNALAQRHLREMREGEDLVIYHTGEERKAVGLARVIQGPYPDPKAKDGKRTVIDVIVGKRLPKPVTLEDMKANAVFAQFELLRQPRLSVVPMTAEHWDALLRAAGVQARR